MSVWRVTSCFVDTSRFMFFVLPVVCCLHQAGHLFVMNEKGATLRASVSKVQGRLYIKHVEVARGVQVVRKRPGQEVRITGLQFNPRIEQIANA